MQSNNAFRSGGEQDERLGEHLAAFRWDAQQQALRPEWFWSAQRAAIRDRVALPRMVGRGLYWAFASALALLVMAGSLLMTSPEIPRTAPSAAATVQYSADDDALMRDVLQASYGTMPGALAPATLLANEVDRGLRSAVKAKGEKR